LAELDEGAEVEEQRRGDLTSAGVEGGGVVRRPLAADAAEDVLPVRLLIRCPKFVLGGPNQGRVTRCFSAAEGVEAGFDGEQGGRPGGYKRAGQLQLSPSAVSHLVGGVIMAQRLPKEGASVIKRAATAVG